MEQEAKRRELYGLLGILPPRDFPISCQCIAVEDMGDYVLEKLVLELNGIEPVPAYLSRPRELKGRVPAVLYNHFHGGQYSLGKEELIKGNFALQAPPYAGVLSSLGYIGLCIDMWNFGERSGRTESELFKELLWKGRVLWGMMVYDGLKALDYLASRDDVDASRLASMGISMGSTMSWWLAALDERIKVCVDLCCLTDYNEFIRNRQLDAHGLYYYVPGLLNSFSASDINKLICPRHHLSLNGVFDKLTPPEGLDRIDGELKEEYEKAGVPERWELVRVNCGHQETAYMRYRIVNFLKSVL